MPRQSPSLPNSARAVLKVPLYCSEAPSPRSLFMMMVPSSSNNYPTVGMSRFFHPSMIL